MVYSYTINTATNQVLTHIAIPFILTIHSSMCYPYLAAIRSAEAPEIVSGDPYGAACDVRGPGLAGRYAVPALEQRWWIGNG